MRSVITSALLLVPTLAAATTMRRLDVAELSRGAALVALVTVQAQRSYWERPEGGRIFTESRVRLDEVWLGAGRVGETRAVVTLGGIVGEIGQAVAGEARLLVGARYVLFLAHDAAGRLRPFGLAQGALPLESELVRAPSIDATLIGDATTLPTDLPTLRRQVRAAGLR